MAAQKNAGDKDTEEKKKEKVLRRPPEEEIIIRGGKGASIRRKEIGPESEVPSGTGKVAGGNAPANGEALAVHKEVAVKVDHLSMKFNLSQEKLDSLKEWFIKFLKRDIKYDEFWALKDINFTLYKGERLGILGLNGAGKSTLLKAIAGVYKPTEGSVYRKGVLAPLLELGAGFDMQYTARENIYLYGAVLGYSKEFIDSKFDEIIKFSELQKFIDVPLKNYSSGMKTRLGFAICTAVDPDILILDEVLSVGDAKFRKKSEKKITSMFSSDVTVLFVSHSLAQVRRICDKAMILDHGKLLAYGDVEEIADRYEEMTEK